MKQRGKPAYTPGERKERWDICEKYLRRNPTLQSAIEEAKRDGVTYPTAVWITAMSKLLERAATEPKP
jgi:hypothetical protein